MNIYALVPLLSVFAYAGLNALARRHNRRRERRAFALYMAAAGIWSAVTFFLFLGIPSLEPYLLSASRVMVVTFAWMVVTYYYFVRTFVNKPVGLGVYGGMAVVLVIALDSGTGFIVRDAFYENGTLDVEYGPGFFAFAAFSLALVLTAAFVLIQHYRVVRTSQERTRVIYLLVGLAILIASSLTNLSPALNKYPLGNLGNLLSAVIISYAILRHRLLEIRFVLRRGVLYSSLSVVVGTVYLLVLFGLQAAFQGRTGFSLGLAAVLALFMAFLFSPMRNFAQRHIDQLFYSNTHHYRNLLLNFSSRMVGVLDLEHLAREMLQPVVRVTNAQWAALLLPDPVSGDFRMQYTAGGALPQDVTGLRLRRDNPLVAWLGRENTAFRAELVDVLPEAKGMWASEQFDIVYHQVELLCPIITRDHLSAILVMGRKETDVPYGEEEMELLMTICSGAAVVIENARTLDSLRQAQLRAEHLLSQMVAAQEEERKRIASELHDGVAQWLVNASYQVQVCSEVLSRPPNGHNIQEDLAGLEETISTSLKELRQVLAGLRPRALEELGLDHAIRDELDKLHARDMTYDYAVEGTPVRLSEAAEIAVYRLVQESLNNVRKHAQATKVDLRILYEPEEVVIHIRDNGKGFDVSTTLEGAIAGGHMGLLGMKERVAALGGTLDIQSRVKMGTTTEIRVPFELMETRKESQWTLSA